MDGLAIAASLNELRPAAEGAFLRTVYRPSRGLFVFHVSGPAKRKILISPRASSIHLTTLDIPNPQEPSSFVMLLRKYLRGGRIEAIRQVGWDRVVVFDVGRRSGSRTERTELIAELVGLRGNLLVVRDGTVLGAARRDGRNRPGQPYCPLTPQPKIDPREVGTEEITACLNEKDPARALARRIDGIGRDTANDILRAVAEDRLAGEQRAKRVGEFLADVMRAATHPEASFDVGWMRAAFYTLPAPAERAESYAEALDRVLVVGGTSGSERAASKVRDHLLRALGKRARIVEKLRDWLDALADADRMRHDADLLMIHQSSLPSGVDRVCVEDPATEEERVIRLSPMLSPIENAQRLYRRVKRLRRGQPHVEGRLKRMQREIDELRAALSAVDAGKPVPEVATRFLPAEDTAVRKTRSPSSRRFSIEGHVVLVGRNAEENDQLLRDAGPEDVWMHARDVSGSHVIVRRDGRREIPERVLRKAAGLAAHYSKAKGERRVDVTIAAAKHVRKPRSAPAGLVIVRHEDTLTVEPGLREWE